MLIFIRPLLRMARTEVRVTIAEAGLNLSGMCASLAKAEVIVRTRCVVTAFRTAMQYKGDAQEKITLFLDTLETLTLDTEVWRL